MEKLTTRGAGVALVATLVAALVAAFLVAQTAAAARAKTMPLVSTAKNADLGKTVLVTRKGLTLYSLSVERRGKFICTDSECLSFWTPFVVMKGTKPTGLAGLATVKRPGGGTQVTYRGGPLYTFYLDRARGDVGGEGFKDVGIWHAAVKRAA
jgi:predicted lipoprotein with Yx(FWY)xxD motif